MCPAYHHNPRFTIAGVVSAPLWNGDTSRFAGMFTVSDIIHLIQYYYLHSSYDNAAHDVEHFRLESIRGMFSPFRVLTLPLISRHAPDIERELDVPPPPLLSIHPFRPLWEACKLLMSTHARRLPLLDVQQTGDEVVLSVLTQYRALKAISQNV